MNNPSFTSSRTDDNPPLIYLVDDEPILLDLAEAILEGEGYRLERFTDPEPALAALQQAEKKPSLLLTDYAMHSMNGLEFIEKFKEKLPEIKTLMVSGTVDEEFIQSSSVQVDSFLRKPYQPGDLIAAVRSILQGLG
jgi:CheY-like chemotaxis protein